jgi:peptidoglycan hydrolase-like protein with peptidoglycan-binding domain
MVIGAAGYNERRHLTPASARTGGRLPPDQENGKEAMEMRRIALAAAAVLAAASGVAGITLAAAVPASAQASCTGSSGYTDAKGFGVLVPTIGNNTHRDDCELGLGNDSQAVVALQETLDGCYGQHLATDGDYGPLTQAAVEVAQRAAHVTADGVYGPVTRDHINWWDFGGDCAKL